MIQPPNDKKKSGFGAFVAHEQEGNDVRAAEHDREEHAAHDATATPDGSTAPAKADGGAKH